MSVEYTERALADIEAVADYYVSIDQSDAGEAVIHRIFETADAIGRSPFIGRRQNAPDVRKKIVKRTRFSIFYLADNATRDVVILAVQHSSRGAPPFDDA